MQPACQAALSLAALALLSSCGSDPAGTAQPPPPPPPTNQAPTIGTPVTSTDHNREYRYLINAGDPDGDSFAVVVRVKPSWMSYDAPGLLLTGTPGWNFVGRSAQVLIQVDDGRDTTTQDFQVAVNLGEIICQQDFGSAATSPYDLPYRVGRSYQVIQTYCPPNPTWGHHNWFAYDFDMATGDTVLATRGGTVLFVRENFVDGNRTPGQENFVFVRHADGTVMHYMHLTLNGALVNVGDVVAQGDPIALTGDTGNSGGPHLHIAVFRDASNFDRQSTLTLNFRNAQGPLDANGGLVQNGSYVALP